MSWIIDKKALTRACRVMGLKSPVFVVMDAGLENCSGMFSSDCYEYEYEGRLIERHLIRILPSLSMREATKTLWHELTHCQQAEKHGWDWEPIYEEEALAVGADIHATRLFTRKEKERYVQIGFEAEAYTMEEKYQHRRLVKRTAKINLNIGLWVLPPY